MSEFFDMLSEFIQERTVWVYAFIFFGKIADVTVATIRAVLINRGERVTGSLLAIPEILIWLIITSSVLQGYQNDVLKIVFYCLAYASGTFLGSWLEERLAFGLCSLQAVASSRDKSDAIAAELRKNGFGVSVFEVQGREGSEHYMLLCTLKRKLLGEAIALVQSVSADAMITVSDIKTQKGGYMKNAGRRARRGIVK